MSKPTFTDGDTQVMIAVLRQVGVEGINNEQLRIELGIKNKTTAGTRLFGLRKKLGINPKAKGSSNAGSGSGKFTDGDTAVMIAVLKMGGMGGINLEKLRADLGIANKTTAGTRLFALRKKLGINPKVNCGVKADGSGKATASGSNSRKSKKRFREEDGEGEEEKDEAGEKVKQVPTKRGRKKARATTLEQTVEGEEPSDASVGDVNGVLDEKDSE